MKINKYFLLQNKKIKSWLKYWLYIKSKDKNYVLSDILDGTSFYLENSSNKNFNLFQINGNSIQDGTPTPTNPIEIENAGDNGYITEVISNRNNTQSQTLTIPCQQHMRSIGNVRDEFVKIDGVWYEKHNIGQVVLNGSERGWTYDSDNFYFRTSNYTFEHVPKANTNDTVQLSNYFKHTSGWGTFRTSHTTNLFYSVQNSGYKLCFRNIDITTVSDWTNWLRSHNVEVIYPTEEPYYLECTQEQIEALESIIRAYTYEPITNINSTDETPAFLKIQYYMEV